MNLLYYFVGVGACSLATLFIVKNKYDCKEEVDSRRVKKVIDKKYSSRIDKDYLLQYIVKMDRETTSFMMHINGLGIITSNPLNYMIMSEIFPYSETYDFVKGEIDISKAFILKLDYKENMYGTH